MIDISAWMDDFVKKLDAAFGERVFFVGLQGSYGRGEASDSSDIDVVVILDEVSELDINRYGCLLDTLSHRELVCGFFSGKDELLNWEPFDLFQFYYDTKPIKGDFDCLLSRIDGEAVSRAVKVGACNIYHGCVHNMLHEKSEEVLRGLYKSASFTLQAIAFEQTGKYCCSKQELKEVLSAENAMVLDTFLILKNGGAVDFYKASAKLLERASAWIKGK